MYITIGLTKPIQTKYIWNSFRLPLAFKLILLYRYYYISVGSNDKGPECNLQACLFAVFHCCITFGTTVYRNIHDQLPYSNRSRLSAFIGLLVSMKSRRLLSRSCPASCGPKTLKAHKKPPIFLRD